ncbi:MAG: OmpA family protein [Spirochaetaceae bacterium]|jgi:outer membrane protein OmpA-like peptidoglycan-associated protein|nr:OmpA family protein [Spirochaetaceae bacterium]
MGNPRGVFILFLFFLGIGGMYAQESKFSFGFGGEISGGIDDPDRDDDDVLSEVYKSGGGGGWSGAFEYRINDLFAAGLKTGTRHDFQYWVTAFEQSIFARIYFVRLNRLDVFAEPGLGGIFAVRESQVRAYLDAYILAGVRIKFGNWYVEPYLGTGYPFWGRVGVMVGYRVPAPKPAPVQTQSADARAERNAADATDRMTTAQRQQQAQEAPKPATPPSPQEPIRTIFFSANSIDFAGLDAETVAANQRNLDDIAKNLMAHPNYRVLLEGHANPTEGTINEEQFELIPLSRQRADAVAEMLVKAGVNRKQIVIAGSGGIHSSNNPEANRRVEITIMRN